MSNDFTRWNNISDLNAFENLPTFKEPEFCLMLREYKCLVCYLWEGSKILAAANTGQAQQ